MLLASLLACAGTRVIRESVYQRGEVESFLRSYRREGAVVERGFDHPAAISSVRLAHILSFVEVEVGQGKQRRRVPAVPSLLIYEVGDALAAAIEQADPNQEVVVMAVRKERRLGIFHTRFLSSLIAYLKGDLLTLHFSHADWEVPKMGPEAGDELPEPKEGQQLMQFRILPDPALTLLGPQTLAVDWRSDRFRDPTRVRLSPTGHVKRRSVLMEAAPEDEEAPAPEGTVPIDRLSPETLRALADLEDRRRRGEISEGEYQVRRREILSADPATP
jgi:hypothetical protein